MIQNVAQLEKSSREQLFGEKLHGCFTYRELVCWQQKPDNYI